MGKIGGPMKGGKESAKRGEKARERGEFVEDGKNSQKIT